MEKDYSNFWALYAEDGPLKAVLARATGPRSMKTETAELEILKSAAQVYDVSIDALRR
jgi:hypothetical protein